MDNFIQNTTNIEYLKAIDANGQEDLFYGYDNDDQATSNRIIITWENH
jgi:hypothetical protein